ncbi:probable beta-d-xylosidase 6, partial [Phtheirospermum japonicum]
ITTRTRAQSLICLLSVDEKIQQRSNYASAVPRFGIPPYEWWSEYLQGIGANGAGVSFDGPVKSATGFPQVILSAATFNRSLWSAVAPAIAAVAKAMHGLGQARLKFWEICTAGN